MKTRACRFFVSLATIFVFASCGGAPPAQQSTVEKAGGPPAIDGASYDIVLEMPGEAPEKDTITFSGGKFESAVCTPLGFPKWTPYQTRASGDADVTEFFVITKHPSGTVMDWRGSARGAKVEGIVVRRLEGEVKTGSFKGSRH